MSEDFKDGEFVEPGTDISLRPLGIDDIDPAFPDGLRRRRFTYEEEFAPYGERTISPHHLSYHYHGPRWQEGSLSFPIGRDQLDYWYDMVYNRGYRSRNRLRINIDFGGRPMQLDVRDIKEFRIEQEQHFSHTTYMVHLTFITEVRS